MTTATISNPFGGCDWIKVNGRLTDLCNHVTGIKKGEYSYQFLIDTNFEDAPHIIEGGAAAGGSKRDWSLYLPSSPEYRIPCSSFVEAVRIINNGY